MREREIIMSESVASEVISAMVGGIFLASVLYPLEVLKTTDAGRDGGRVVVVVR